MASKKKTTAHANKLRAARKKAAQSGIMKYKDEIPKIPNGKKKKKKKK